MADRDDKDLIGAATMNRRGLLKCMGWAGTGVVWGLSGGVPRTLGLIGEASAAEVKQAGLTFVQISDSHIGFHLPPNPDPDATLTEAIEKITAMPTQPAFLVHTGDISHLSKEEQWDDADQIIKSANKQVSSCPASTTSPTPTTARPISRATARIPRGRAGTALITRACISSA
jgi:hypothetical protein